MILQVSLQQPRSFPLLKILCEAGVSAIADVPAIADVTAIANVPAAADVPDVSDVIPAWWSIL